MGTIIEEICCINSEQILENDHFRDSFKDSIRNGNNITDTLGSLGTSSVKRPLPSSEIRFNNQKSRKPNQLKSLSRLPISTKTVIRKQTGSPFDYYKIVKKLGHGSFGKVYKVIHKQTGNIRAMKVIPKNNMRYGFTDHDINLEINILKNLEHPHIIKLFEFFVDEDNYYLVNEYCTEGNLCEKLHEIKVFPEVIVKILMAQIFNALIYLNEKGIIHSDIKLENVMVDSILDNGQSTFEIKNKSSFIESLIQDANDINEQLQKNRIRRSVTVNNKFIFNKFGGNFKRLNSNNEKLKNLKKSLPFGYNLKFGKNNLNKNKKYNKNINNKNNYINNILKFNEDNGMSKNENNKFNISNYLEEKIDEKENLDDSEKNNIKNVKDLSELSEKSIDTDNYDSSKNILNYNIEHSSKQLYFYNLKVKPIEKTQQYRSNRNILNVEKKMKFLNTIKTNKNPYLNKTKIENKPTLLKVNTLKLKNYVLKLIDFGCSKIFTKYRRTFEDTIGTLVYCAPEVLKNNYDEKCDIWASGVIMYVLLCGHYPFYGKSEEEITKKILKGNFTFSDKHFKDVSDSAKNLIKKCLIYDKDKRISAREALNHEFFTGEININPNNLFEDEIDSKNVLNSLKNYSDKSKFYQTVLAYLSHNFADKEQINKLSKIFNKIDLNLDGKISKEELYTAYEEEGIKIDKEELNKIIESIDFDKNGYIEYEEFIRVTLPEDQLFTDVNLKNAFDMFDLDKNGTISMNEVLEVLGMDKETNEKVIQQLMSEMPGNGDEDITFEQFKKIILG